MDETTECVIISPNLHYNHLQAKLPTYPDCMFYHWKALPPLKIFGDKISKTFMLFSLGVKIP